MSHCINVNSVVLYTLGNDRSPGVWGSLGGGGWGGVGGGGGGLDLPMPYAQVGPLTGGPQCRMSNLRNGYVPCHYFKNVHVDFKMV